jgi:type IV pilus assembly protein PilC
MAKFDWEGTNTSGELKTGTIEADTLQQVKQSLIKSRIEIIRIAPQKKGIGEFFAKLGKVSTKSMVIFTRQMSTMIDAGLPLVSCLDILASQEPDPKLQAILFDVKDSVEQGNTFADSLKRHPAVFDNLFVNLVAAGEVGGVLDTVLSRLADYTEKSQALQQKVKSALKYPVTIMIVAVGITAGLLWKVVPQFAGMFKSLGDRPLPALTQTMVEISNGFVGALPFLVAGVIGFVTLLKLLLKNNKIAYAKDQMMLVTPGIGNVIKKASISKFTRTLATLVSAGVPILDAMTIVARTAGNRVIEAAVLYCRDKVSEGKTIAAPLMEKQVFPKMVIQMIAVGESTGALDIMLGKIADFYDDEVDQAVEGMTAMLEPIIMVVIGGIVGTILIAMYLPIFSMADGAG